MRGLRANRVTDPLGGGGDHPWQRPVVPRVVEELLTGAGAALGSSGPQHAGRGRGIPLLGVRAHMGALLLSAAARH